MSRSGYTNDCNYLDLYREAVERAIHGKRGQAFLKALGKALDAMPVKRLIADDYLSSGEVCAIAVLGLARGVEMSEWNADDPDHEAIGKAFNIAPSLSREVAYMNDENRHNESPEQRWIRMRAWVRENMHKEVSHVSHRP
jgi:hypothetical protein